VESSCDGYSVKQELNSRIVHIWTILCKFQVTVLGVIYLAAERERIFYVLFIITHIYGYVWICIPEIRQDDVIISTQYSLNWIKNPLNAAAFF
jgi:hypothetical protein